MSFLRGIAANEDRAKQYKRASITYFVFGILFSWVTSIIFLMTRSSRKLADTTQRSVGNDRASEGVTVVIFMLLSWLITLPLSYLRGYRMEHQYEMSNQTLGAWFGEQLKGLALQLVLIVPMSQVILSVIRRRPKDWWMVLSGLAVPFTVVLAHLAPVLILPLFNTYQPLRDRTLAERLMKLAERTGIQVADIYEMDMSRQTKAANAAVTGIGSTKRIILSDTLIEELTHDEIETIVAHEIAHQAHHDVWRLLGVSLVATVGTSWATQKVFQRIHQRTEQKTGIRGAGYVEALPLLSLVTSVVGMLAMPLQNAYSRYIERKADAYALELTDNPEAFSSSLDKIATLSLADRDPTRLEQVLLHSHPTISDRRAACEEYARQARSA